MPFIDGLQLAEKAVEIRPNLKVIILSAYGEFEYAKRAIRLDVFHYLLKPVDVAEFKDVMSHVIHLCEEEKERGAREEKLLEGYRKGLRLDKSRLLLDLLHGSRSLRSGCFCWIWTGSFSIRSTTASRANWGSCFPRRSIT